MWSLTATCPGSRMTTPLCADEPHTQGEWQMAMSHVSTVTPNNSERHVRRDSSCCLANSRVASGGRARRRKFALGDAQKSKINQVACKSGTARIRSRSTRCDSTFDSMPLHEIRVPQGNEIRVPKGVPGSPLLGRFNLVSSPNNRAGQR